MVLFVIVTVYVSSFINSVENKNSDLISSDVNKFSKLQQFMKNGLGQLSLVETILRKKRQTEESKNESDGSSLIDLRTKQSVDHKHVQNNKFEVNDVISNFDLDISEDSRNPNRLVSISEYVSQEHLSHDKFKPTVLKSIVQNPESLKILPRERLMEVFNDPIFKVSVPEAALAPISKVLNEMKDKEELGLGSGFGDDFDYGFDYSDYEVEDIGDFLNDLNPEFLADVSPSLIVSYIEGASPDELRDILKDSTLLRNLPPETLAELLKQLPKNLILTILESDGVQELFSDSLTSQDSKIRELLNTLAPILIKNLDADILASLPLSLIKAHLDIEGAIVELFKDSNKLESIIIANPSILKEISFDFISEVLTKNPGLESEISDKVIISLIQASPDIIDKFPINFLTDIAGDRPWIIREFPQESIDSLATRHEVLFNINNNELSKLLEYRPSLLKILIKLPKHVLNRFLNERSDLLDFIPKGAEPYLRQLIMTDEFLIKLKPRLLAEMANQPLIRKYLNKYLLITILRVHPTLPSVIPIEDILEFIPFLLDPWFRTRLPCLTISTLSSNVELVKKIPGDVLETIMTSKRMLSCIPIRNLEKLLSQRVGLSRVSLFGLLTSFSQLPRNKLSIKLIRLILMEQAPEIAENILFGGNENY